MGLFDFLSGLFGGTDDGNDEDDGASPGRSSDDGASPDRSNEGGASPDRSNDGAGTDPAPGGDGAGASPATSGVGDVVGGDPGGFREEAEEFVDFWGEYGFDYSPESLRALDEYMRNQGPGASYLQVTTESGEEVAFAPIASSAACYFGEVLVRNYDAEWVREGGGWAVEIGDGDSALVNVFHVAHDCLDEEPKFAFTHDVLLEEVGISGEPVSE